MKLPKAASAALSSILQSDILFLLRDRDEISMRDLQMWHPTLLFFVYNIQKFINKMAQ